MIAKCGINVKSNDNNRYICLIKIGKKKNRFFPNYKYFYFNKVPNKNNICRYYIYYLIINMFTQQKFYDLNIRSDAKRKQDMAQNQKVIKDSFNAPTVVEPTKHRSNVPIRGTPAYALSMKQRQQQRDYTFQYGEDI
jgi:hypothetical protein